MAWRFRFLVVVPPERYRRRRHQRARTRRPLPNEPDGAVKVLAKSARCCRRFRQRGSCKNGTKHELATFDGGQSFEESRGQAARPSQSIAPNGQVRCPRFTLEAERVT